MPSKMPSGASPQVSVYDDEIFRDRSGAVIRIFSESAIERP